MTQPDLFTPPHQGRSPRARHASWTGAQAAAPHAASQAGRLLARLQMDGPLDRYQLAEREGLPVTTVCARLRALQQRGWIQEAGLNTKRWGDGRITRRVQWTVTR